MAGSTAATSKDEKKIRMNTIVAPVDRAYDASEEKVPFIAAGAFRTRHSPSAVFPEKPCCRAEADDDDGRSEGLGRNEASEAG